MPSGVATAMQACPSRPYATPPDIIDTIRIIII